MGIMAVSNKSKATEEFISQADIIDREIGFIAARSDDSFFFLFFFKQSNPIKYTNSINPGYSSQVYEVVLQIINVISYKPVLKRTLNALN